jgi:hypothetical protein
MTSNVETELINNLCLVITPFSFILVQVMTLTDMKMLGLEIA